MTIKDIINQITDCAYHAARAEYDALAPSEKTADAFRNSATVQVEAHLAGNAGKLIAAMIADRLTDTFETNGAPDYDLIGKEQDL